MPQRPQSLLDLKDAAASGHTALHSILFCALQRPLGYTNGTPGHPTNAFDSVHFLHFPSHPVCPHSLGSLTALLDSLAADPSSFYDKELPFPPNSKTTSSDFTTPVRTT